MKNAFAGGGDFPPQQTIQIEYNWIDRLIQWAQSNTVECFVGLALIVVILFLLWRLKK